MSRLDELIKELCPEGGESMQIGDFADVKTGKGITKKDSVEFGSFPIISGGKEPMGYYHSNNRAANTLTISRVGANAGYVNYITEDFYLNDKCFSVIPSPNYSSKISSKFLYYVTKNMESALVGMQSEGGVPTINTQKVCSIKVPVPPLPVQEEIVKILDKFTDYVTELQAELQARKQQYEYYRDTLLAGNESIPMVELKEIATDIYRGAGIKRDELCDNGIPCVRYGEIYTQYNTWFDECISHTTEDVVSNPKYFEHGDILFAITGESVEDIAKSVAYVGHEKCLAGGDIVVMKHDQNPRYLAHVLSTSYARAQKSKGKVKSKVVHSNVPSIEKITIPLPSLEIQDRYANALDNFESVCNNLKIGLPAEIEAHQKQYEYYRDVLLTFAETGSIIDRQTDRQTEHN